MAPVIYGFAALFLFAFFILSIIAFLLSPSLIGLLRKSWRLFIARRNRNFLYSFDQKEREQETRALEGLYYFE